VCLTISNFAPSITGASVNTWDPISSDMWSALAQSCHHSASYGGCYRGKSTLVISHSRSLRNQAEHCFEAAVSDESGHHPLLRFGGGLPAVAQRVPVADQFVLPAEPLVWDGWDGLPSKV